MSPSSLTALDYSIGKVATCQTLVVFDDRVSDIDILVQALLPGAVGVTIDFGTCCCRRGYSCSRSKHGDFLP